MRNKKKYKRALPALEVPFKYLVLSRLTFDHSSDRN